MNIDIEKELNEKYELIEYLVGETDDLKKEVSKLVVDLQGEEILKGAEIVLWEKIA